MKNGNRYARTFTDFLLIAVIVLIGAGVAAAAAPMSAQAQSTTSSTTKSTSKTTAKAASKTTSKSSKTKPSKSRSKSSKSKASAKKPGIGDGPCVRPDTMAAWFRTQRDWQNLDANHDWTNDSMRVAVIEGARAAALAMPSHGDVEMGATLEAEPHMRGIDTTAIASTRAMLRAMAATRKWPVRSMVGAAGVHAAWVVSSGDTALARAAMHRMMEAGPGEASPADVAVLEDMLRLENGRKQIYGSQLTMKRDTKGVAHIEPAPTEDLPHVDMRREAAGLPKLADAICAVRAMVPGAK